jgi:hypothetical protein
MTRTAKILDDADYIASVIYGDFRRLIIARESFASCAIEGNAVAGRCCKLIYFHYIRHERPPGTSRVSPPGAVLLHGTCKR